jgi:hypothetical protein
MKSSEPNGANKIVWAVSLVALGVLVSVLGWNSATLVDLKTEVAVLNAKFDAYLSKQPNE